MTYVYNDAASLGFAHQGIIAEELASMGFLGEGEGLDRVALQRQDSNWPSPTVSVKPATK